MPNKNDMDSWVLGNPGQYGFYRVNYDRSNWLSLTSQLKDDHEVISGGIIFSMFDLIS